MLGVVPSEPVQSFLTLLLVPIHGQTSCLSALSAGGCEVHTSPVSVTAVCGISAPASGVCRAVDLTRVASAGVEELVSPW